MSDKVKALLDRVRETAVTVGETAGATARQAGRYAGHMVDVAKLNMQIFDLKTEINGLLRSIGQMVYGVHLGMDAEERRMTELFSQLDEKNTAIDELKGRIAILRSARPCPACGVFCGEPDQFCKQCGQRL